MAGGRVYSEQFFALYGATATYQYQVPAGYRAVIRHVSVCNLGAANAGLLLSVNGNYFYIWVSPAANTMNSMECHQVVHAGGIMRAQTTGPAIGVGVGGYLLTDSPQLRSDRTDAAREAAEIPLERAAVS